LRLCVACSEPLPIATVELGLVPEDVTSIVVWVSDVERSEVVASATVAPPITTVDLGVPAEQELEFSVLARTAQPGPPRLGGLMPGWVGRALKRIPLGREQVFLPITAHPAGALTIVPRIELDRARIRLDSDLGDPPLELELVPDVERVLALRAGRYRLSAADDDVEIVAGDGLFVARRIESIGVVEIVPKSDPLPPEAVRRIEVALTDASGDPLELPIVTSTAATFRVRIEGRSATDMPAESDAEVEIEIDTTAALGQARRFTLDALPAITPPLEIRGMGRLSISASAILRDDDDRARTLHDELRANVISTGVEAGPPVRLELTLRGSEEDLVRGARVSAELIDRRGLYSAGAQGTLDFSESDPWLFFPRGPSAEVTPDDGGHLIREVARPSGPRGLFVVLRASFTSTAVPGTLTASVTLPVLESSE
jgi:hypothetical protein